MCTPLYRDRCDDPTFCNKYNAVVILSCSRFSAAAITLSLIAMNGGDYGDNTVVDCYEWGRLWPLVYVSPPLTTFYRSAFAHSQYAWSTFGAKVDYLVDYLVFCLLQR